jgi:hypothetical protein
LPFSKLNGIACNRTSHSSNTNDPAAAVIGACKGAHIKKNWSRGPVVASVGKPHSDHKHEVGQTVRIRAISVLVQFQPLQHEWVTIMGTVSGRAPSVPQIGRNRMHFDRAGGGGADAVASGITFGAFGDMPYTWRNEMNFPLMNGVAFLLAGKRADSLN